MGWNIVYASGASSDPLDLPLVTEQTFSATHLGYFNTRTEGTRWPH